MALFSECVFCCTVVLHEADDVYGYSMMLYCNCVIVGGEGVGGGGSVRSACGGRKLSAGLDTNT